MSRGSSSLGFDSDGLKYVRELPMFVLASASPRRLEILGNLGFNHVVTMPTDCEPDFEKCRRYSMEEIKEKVKTASKAKAMRVVKTLNTGSESERKDTIIIGSDTVVVHKGKVLEKPKDNEEAEDMLHSLSGRWHRVVTGLSVVHYYQKRVVTSCATTDVHFRHLEDEEIKKYVSLGRSRDKAGAYGIQELGGLFVSEIRGSYSNVVGLPAELLDSLFKKLGWEIIKMQSR